jgi:hypothetical protein
MINHINNYLGEIVMILEKSFYVDSTFFRDTLIPIVENIA